jgi:hypothetical protein
MQAKRQLLARAAAQVSGEHSSQLHERHDASDFDTETQDKISGDQPTFELPNADRRPDASARSSYTQRPSGGSGPCSRSTAS